MSQTCAPDPADWPALWAQMLQVRNAQHAASGRIGWLQADPMQGWCLTGPCSPASAHWFAFYKPLLDARLAPARARARAASSPWVLAQLGQSLDGCIATASGDSHFVTGAPSLLHLHRLRALCDAVLVGAGTVAADDPQLTTRRVSGPNAVRVVLDPAARLDGRARVFGDAAAPTLWLCDRRHAAQAQARLAGAAAEVLAVDGLLDAGEHADPTDPVNPAKQTNEGPNLARAMAVLAARGLRVLLVEGGGVTVSRCLAAGVLDRLHLVIAPVIIGAGRRGLQHLGPARLADCPRPLARQLTLGDDMLWDLDLRSAAAAAASPG
jgi:riboflavin biosynthesis pyrimidine reductase